MARCAGSPCGMWFLLFMPWPPVALNRSFGEEGGRELLVNEGKARRPGLSGLTCQCLFPHLQNGSQLCHLGRLGGSVVPQVKQRAQHRVPGMAPGSGMSKIYSPLPQTFMELTARGLGES